MPGSFLFLLSVRFVFFFFLLQENQVMTILLQPEENSYENEGQMETRTQSMKNITGGQAYSCLSTR